MLAMSLKFHILKLGTLILSQYRVGELKCPKLAISDLGILDQLLKGVSWPRVWFVGPTITIGMILLAYNLK